MKSAHWLRRPSGSPVRKRTTSSSCLRNRTPIGFPASSRSSIKGWVCPVHLLPRSCDPSGARPRECTRLRHHRSGMRRLSFIEFRRLRLARTSVGLRHQRLRRNLSRLHGNGTSRDLGASLILAARDRSFSRSIADEAVRAATTSYRERMVRVCRNEDARNLVCANQHRSRPKSISVKTRTYRPDLKRKQKQARSQNSETVVPKLTTMVDGRRLIKDTPPVLYHFDSMFTRISQEQQALMAEEYKKSLTPDRRRLYERFVWQDTAIKVVGVGSVGTRCYVSLLLAADDDPLFIQVKGSAKVGPRTASWKKPLCQSGTAGSGRSAGHASGQRHLSRLVQFKTFHDYYIRQFRDMKVSAEIETFKADTLVGYDTDCAAGRWLAPMPREVAQPMIAGYLGSSEQFDDALARYSEAYADQAERDFQSFQGRCSLGTPLSRAGQRSRFGVSAVGSWNRGRSFQGNL